MGKVISVLCWIQTALNVAQGRHKKGVYIYPHFCPAAYHPFIADKDTDHHNDYLCRSASHRT
jgi:hypothetical protein